MITAEQLQQVLNDLPPISKVEGDYYRVVVREYQQTTPHYGRAPSKDDGVRFFEFRKNDCRWELVSVPKI